MPPRSRRLLLTGLLGATLTFPALADDVSIPSVVVTVENAQPSRGTFLTPPWVGIHDGTFDLYDRGEPASSPLGGNEIESIAEDGNNGPVTLTFADQTGGAPQASLAGPAGPLAPGDRASRTFNVDPVIDRYFSYASMVIPSNDAFIANGNPLAHLLFDSDGGFVGEGFIVSGDESLDAGTEVNDELSGNVAFLNQGAPNTGITENGVVTSPHPGFAAPGSLAYPDGVLNHPVFGNSSFNDADTGLLEVRFQYVDLGGRVRFETGLSPDEEVQAEIVDSDGSGSARATARDARELEVRVRFRGLSGPLTMAHLHLGQAGSNGPVVVDLGSGIRRNSVRFTALAADLTGPLEGQDLVALLNEIAAGNVYVNLHTGAFPAGELRGQLALRDVRDRGGDDDDDN